MTNGCIAFAGKITVVNNVHHAGQRFVWYRLYKVDVIYRPHVHQVPVKLIHIIFVEDVDAECVMHYPFPFPNRHFSCQFAEVVNFFLSPNTAALPSNSDCIAEKFEK